MGMNDVLQRVFLSRQITHECFLTLGFSDQKINFLFKRSLTIVNEGSLLTVVRKGRFSKRPFFNKRKTIVFLTKNYRF